MKLGQIILGRALAKVLFFPNSGLTVAPLPGSIIKAVVSGLWCEFS